MDAVNRLEQVVALFNSGKSIINEQNQFELSVTMTDEFKLLLSQLDDQGLSFDIDGEIFKLDDIEVGNTYNIEFEPVLLREEGVSIYRSWEEFFSFPMNLYHSPEAFYIHSEQDIYLGCDNDLQKTVKCYIDTLSLISCLSDCSDHQEESSDQHQNVIFLHKARLEIECKYSLEDIEHGLDGITSIVTWLDQKTHSDQRKAIFKAALYDNLKSVKKADRFKYLISHFGVFSTQVIEDYSLYVSEFSFDDVRLEYQEKKREYLTKINDTFSAIQTKALGIPVSIALVALRLSSHTQQTTMSIATDFLLYSAACIYGLMMLLLIFNQKHSLKSIKHEYKGQITRLKKEYPTQHELIKKEFKELDNRHFFQQCQLNIFALLTIVFIYLVDHYLDFELWTYILDTFPLASSLIDWKDNALEFFTLNNGNSALVKPHTEG
ncbi:hypothetical protein [Vibrio splendidus]|jgi:hypothetical protein|uniref:hypothetical protein n=1 Tax=Vibrio splendidus TaxID=29497 RepID=UPI000D34D0CD|nr:hypothetical protein [Vibrio splendidus]PTP34449.1 hypothetical protein CWN95_13370 [Vibrio splendidus]